MSHRLSLSKLTGKPAPAPAQPLMSFRYNPGDEDIEELQPRSSRDQKRVSSREASLERPSKATEDKPDSSSASASTERPHGEKQAARSDAHQPSQAGSSQVETKRKSPDVVAPEAENSKAEASPVKDYLSKFGKKSMSIESTPQPAGAQGANEGATSDSWFTGLRERLTKRIEEKIQSKAKKDEDGRQVSDDERPSRSATPVEDGQEAVEGTIPQPPSEATVVSYTRRQTPPRSESPTRTPQPSLADEAGGNTSGVQDPEFTSWEFVEQPERPRTLPAKSKESAAEASATVTEQPPSPLVQAKEYVLSNIPRVAIAFVVLVIAMPLPSFLSGFLMGIVLSALGFSFAWYLFVPTEPKVPFQVPDYKHMPPLRVPKGQSCVGDGVRADATYEGWMCQLPFSMEYNVETHHMNNTRSVNLVLSGCTLRLRWPKSGVPRRAMWNEKRPDPIFIDHRHYNISNAKLMLLPEKLSKERIWNRKYPICLVIPSEEHFDEQGKELAALAAASTNNVEEQQQKAQSNHTVLYLFARTCRSKEEWFHRFRQAISSSSTSRAKKTQFGDAASTGISFEVYMAELLMRHQEERHPSPKTSSGRFAAGHSAAHGATSTSSVRPSPQMVSSPQSYQTDTQWINVLIGRMFHDFLTHREWADVVRDRIQRKLSKIKVPFFMEELMVTDINLGSQLPYIRRTSEAVTDERGVWVDLDLTYSGAFYMTLTTKLNLMRLKRSQAEEMQSFSYLEIPLGENVGAESLSRRRLTLSSINHENTDEDSAVSSDEDDGNVDRAESSAISKDPSSASAGTGKKILDLMDKIAQSKYFQQATENRYIKRKMEEMSNTPLVLTVEVTYLIGTLALNVPPPPTDRIWYGFRTLPKMQLVAKPKLGEKEVTIARVTERIEKMLFMEFQRVLVMPNMDDFVVPIMHSDL